MADQARGDQPDWHSVTEPASPLPRGADQLLVVVSRFLDVLYRGDHPRDEIQHYAAAAERRQDDHHQPHDVHIDAAVCGEAAAYAGDLAVGPGSGQPTGAPSSGLACGPIGRTHDIRLLVVVFVALPHIER